MMVAAALVILIGGILIIGEQTHIFQAKVGYRTVFAAAWGLGVGSPVTMAGIQIGVVDSITLPRDPDSAGIAIELSVNEDYRERVRAGTTATTKLLQYLTNEKYVALTPGDPALPLLPEGAQIPAKVDQELMARGATIADSLEAVTRTLLGILEAIQQGEGLLGRAIMDPEFGTEGLESLKAASKSLEELLGSINAGRGLAGRLVTDPEFAERVSTGLTDSLDRVARILARLEAGEGALGELLQAEGTSEESVESLLSDLSGAVASLRRTVEGLESTDGLYHRWFRDAEYAERVATNLDETLARLASVMRKIDDGEGTLGALVNDPSLARAAEDLVFGANESKLVRWAVRHYREKGEKSDEAETPEETPEEAAEPADSSQ
jgi:phospholipid/cholesterol/gamma-HCH transport system substrate-binding protein